MMLRYSHLIFIIFTIIGNCLGDGDGDGDCRQEFDNCAVQRDCCPTLTCVTGDWQYTTDSTCLSLRSELIEMKARAYSKDEKVTLIMEYYETIDSTISAATTTTTSAQKSKEDVEKILRRYDNEFPKLISKLERKYGVSFDAFDSNSNSEL